MSKSDVIRLKQQIQTEHEAAQQALYGLASGANHASINARMQQGADYLLTLLDAGKYEDVARLMETTAWAREEVTGNMTTNENIQSERGNMA